MANPEKDPVNRRKGKRDRRSGGAGAGPIDNPRTRFSLGYFLVVFLVLAMMQSVLARQGREVITYSELKQKVATNQVAEVRIGPTAIDALPRDTARADGPLVWRATPPPQPDDTFIPLLDAHGVRYEGAVQGWLSQALVWLLPLGVILLFWMYMLRKMNPTQGVLTVGKSRAQIVGEEGTGITFDDVAGIDEAKQETEEIVEFLQRPEKFAKLGARIPKGVLLVGPPGTGKTLLARAVAGEAGVTFFSISGAEFVEMFVGVGAARVRDLFAQAKAQAPCIIFIDELDALGKARGAGGIMGGHDEREQTLNQLLVEMDGFGPRLGVIIMAATNRPEILDPALLRPGRFDRQILVDRPDVKGRFDILKLHAADIRLDPEVDLSQVARRTPGFVGADLANLLNEAALLAARRDQPTVKMAEIDDAVDRIIAGLEKKNRLINDKERRIVAYHEAGHAIVAERVTTADPVHKISIIPRGLAALGYTQQLPTEDRYLLTKQELMDRVAVLLGGRVAEEIVFDEVSTGAGNDLERVTDLARRMVMEYGMSRELGPVNYRNAAAPRFLPDGDGPMFGGMEGRKYSEDTARMIDREVRGIIDGTYQRVREILEHDRHTLDTLSERLLETEVVDEEELRRIMGLPRRTRPIDEGRVVHTPPVGTDQADAADASVVDEEDESGRE